LGEGLQRIREHLYRNHALSKWICKRCDEAFKKEELLELHQRARTPCSVQIRTIRDGLTEVQVEKLHQRDKGASDEKKWEDIYTIIFPDEPIPSSPCKSKLHP
jgi:hypothetical protein